MRNATEWWAGEKAITAALQVGGCRRCGRRSRYVYWRAQAIRLASPRTQVLQRRIADIRTRAIRIMSGPWKAAATRTTHAHGDDESRGPQNISRASRERGQRRAKQETSPRIQSGQRAHAHTQTSCTAPFDVHTWAAAGFRSLIQVVFDRKAHRTAWVFARSEWLLPLMIVAVSDSCDVHLPTTPHPPPTSTVMAKSCAIHVARYYYVPQLL